MSKKVKKAKDTIIREKTEQCFRDIEERLKAMGMPDADIENFVKHNRLLICIDETCRNLSSTQRQKLYRHITECTSPILDWLKAVPLLWSITCHPSSYVVIIPYFDIPELSGCRPKTFEESLLQITGRTKMLVLETHCNKEEEIIILNGSGDLQFIEGTRAPDISKFLATQKITAVPKPKETRQ